MIVVYFTKGLDEVVAAELGELAPDAVVHERTERFIVFDPGSTPVEEIESRLRSGDDLRTLVAGPADVSGSEGFEALCAEAGVATREALATAGRDQAPPWSITVSARKPVWKRKPAWDPAPPIAAHLGAASPAGKERMPVDLRLQVDAERMHLALNREPRVVGRKEEAPVRLGALRPSVAAAMCRLARSAAAEGVDERGVYDPFAGTGTIAVEAARLELPIFASDIDPEAVKITRGRLAKLVAAGGLPGAHLDEESLAHRVFVHDIRRGLPSRVEARLVVGNLPWGAQVALERRGELYDSLGPVAAEALAAGGACALLSTNHEQLMARLRRHVPKQSVSALQIGLLGQQPAIVLVSSRGEGR